MSDVVAAWERETAAALWLTQHLCATEIEFTTPNFHWRVRERYLMRGPSWRRRRALAHNLGTGEPFNGVDRVTVIESKRRYQWAETSFSGGFLSAKAFMAEAHLWDELCQSFAARTIVSVPLHGWPQIQKEDRRLRRLGRQGEINYHAWMRLGVAISEQRKRDEQWRQRRLASLERRRQLALLREGHQTLTAIRRHLHGAVRSRPQESRLAKTLPI